MDSSRASSALLLTFLLFLIFDSADSDDEVYGLRVGVENRDLAAEDQFATCGGCFCIPETGETCPETQPQSDFIDIIPNLRGIELENPMDLSCDPYLQEDCDTAPSLEQGGACVVETSRPLLAPRLRCPERWSYRLTTYPGTVQEALDEGLTVTHQGPCGTCSSLQDLSVYMERTDLAEEGTQCGIAGLSNISAAVDCFQDAGFTEGCAAIWAYNTRKTASSCWISCWIQRLAGIPNNGAAPRCRLARCLQCDENNAGPLFKQFAGRTRRNSGLLSTIVRPCSSLLEIDHQDICEL